MRKRPVVRCLLLLALLAPVTSALSAAAPLSSLAAAATSSTATRPPPQEFGSDWDDPRTAEPAITRPDGRVCKVEIVSHGFADFSTYRRAYTPPADCAGPWHKVVLDLHGQVQGRQYDRMGQIRIGGVTVLRTSTPEPSRDGIQWQVEKDITAYAPLLTQVSSVEMELGNLVNETYTGIFQIQATLSFYPADADHPAALTANSVQALSNAHRVGADLVGGFVIPSDTRQLVAEVYANGSGGGCEEFWYLTAPVEGYSCRSEHGPYRELQVLVDGKVAGLAAPYPHIYTGGWSNPFLWYAVPAPQTFDLHPQQFDLSPFIGLLNDGKPHELRVRVLGLAHDAEGWSLLPNLQIWRDPQGRRVRAGLTRHVHAPAQLANPITATSDGTRLTATGSGQLSLAGWVEDSHGRREIEISYEVGMQSRHDWTHDENNDRLQVEWTDRRMSRSRAAGEPWQTREELLRFGLDGGIASVPVDGHPRLTTDLVIHVDDYRSQQDGAAPARWTQLNNRFDGQASYTQEVPREQRNAVGHSRQQVQMRDSEGQCQARRIETVNGAFVADSTGCQP